MNHTERLKAVWRDVYDPRQNVTDVIEQYFDEDYTQCINGVTMDRAQYIDHVMEQKKNMVVDTMDYQHIIEKDDELFALYYPKGKNSSGLPVEAEVIAYYQFKHHKILRIHGQVRLIHGDLSDVDMKS